MFTGIVTHRGHVAAVRGAGPGTPLHLVIVMEAEVERAVIGSSIAVQGVCLTVTEIESTGPDGAVRYHFDAIPETLRKTNLGALVEGAPVNLEGSLRVGDEIGGHWVQGHVDGTGTITEFQQSDGGDVRITVALPAALAGQVLPKGSITVDGVSLTVGEVLTDPGGARFHLYLIPHTLAVTTLGQVRVGAEVNLELDVMGRWVAHHMEAYLAHKAPPPGA